MFRHACVLVNSDELTFDLVCSIFLFLKAFHCLWVYVIWIHLETSCSSSQKLLVQKTAFVHTPWFIFNNLMIWSDFLPNLFVILTVFLFLLPSVRSLLIYSFLCGVSYKSWKLSECRTEPHLKLADLSSLASLHPSMTEVVLKMERKRPYIENEKRRCEDWKTTGFGEWGFLSALLHRWSTHGQQHTQYQPDGLERQSKRCLSCFDLRLLYLCLGVCDSFCALYSDFSYKELFVWLASALSWAVIGWELRAYTWLVRQIFRSQKGFDAELKPVWGANNTHICTCSL